MTAMGSRKITSRRASGTKSPPMPAFSGRWPIWVVYYDGGQGVGQDYGKAREWYEKAAVRDPVAMRSLAVLYDNGRGVRQDYCEGAGVV